MDIQITPNKEGGGKGGGGGGEGKKEVWRIRTLDGWIWMGEGGCGVTITSLDKGTQPFVVCDG